MTIEEKAGQLSCFADMIRPPIADMNPLVNIRNAQTLIAEIKAGRIGVLMNGVGAAGALEAQKAAVEGSRLKIPLIFAADVIHGFRTVFPIPLGESASFDPHLAERTARGAAIGSQRLGPALDLRADGRRGPRPALGPGGRGRGRGRLSGRGSGRRPGARLPGQGPARRRQHAGHAQALRRLWRGDGGA
jgi:beta-glucosidase